MPQAPASTTDLSALRPWQQKAVLEMRDWDYGTYLIAAAPGAGKTRPSLHFAKEEIEAGRVDRVVIVCPTAPLTRQWAAAAAEQGIQLLPDSPHLEPPGGFHGVSVTYARAAASAKRWASSTTRRTLIVADEAHHLGEELAWGDGFNLAFTRAERWLLLSGTPFRSDRTPIPGAEYDNDGYIVPNISYKYGDAVKDRVCRPIRFIPFDGTLQWVSGDRVVEGSFADALTGSEAARRYRTAISTELESGLPRILGQAAERLKRLRDYEHPDAGGLIVAADSSHAREIARILRHDHGEDPTTVLYTDPNAHKKLADFARSDNAWIVAVNMVSEGVDIPRLRVGVYAAAAKTPLIFRQVVGRFVRTIPGRPPTDPSWLYVPADQRLMQHATDVEDDLKHLMLPKDEDPDAFDEPVERRLAERGEQIEFKPVLADVEVQPDLFAGLGGIGAALGEDADPVVGAHAGFTGSASAESEAAGEAGLGGMVSAGSAPGGGGGLAGGMGPSHPPREPEPEPVRPAQFSGRDAAAALGSDELDPWAALDEDDEDSAPARSWQRAKPKKKTGRPPVPESEKPAWQVQEQLRKRRHSLVSELARATKSSQAQVNSEINQSIGVGKVEQATNEQLERSIQLLLDRLSKRR